ncbi:MAG: hypothetical protein JWM44_1326 [Bacilli bacterium]|nr:hypothetical protein [Bacilli bacterium]
MSDPEQGEQPKQPEQSEREKLEQEKIALAKKLGIWDKDEPVENFQETKEYKRIRAIDVRLWELVKD